jgi:acyl-coenzyme A synthetase/AMP-(fatty) acid ligase
MLSSGVIPIGRPHPEVQFYLIDEFGRLIDELDIAGELYIGGRQLMDGYWNSPDLSAEVMVTDIVAGERVYRTGDIVYRSSADEYVYVGRADRVVKRSGIRISLVEITDAFSVISGVSNAATVVFDNDGVLGIATFLVVRSEVLQVDLYRQAREILPASMLPDHMLVVDAIPLLASGKTDDRALLVSAGLKPLVRTRA